MYSPATLNVEGLYDDLRKLCCGGHRLTPSFANDSSGNSPGASLFSEFVDYVGQLRLAQAVYQF
jgi:hypothetical protein